LRRKKGDFRWPEKKQGQRSTRSENWTSSGALQPKGLVITVKEKWSARDWDLLDELKRFFKGNLISSTSGGEKIRIHSEETLAIEKFFLTI